MAVHQLKEALSSFFFSLDAKTVKVVLLALAFFCISCTFTCVNELKDSLFIICVGKDAIKWAKLWSLIALIPAVLIYSRLVDILSPFRLLSLYSLFYAGVCALSGFFLTTNFLSGYKLLFGWSFYFFMEGFWPFVVGVFWAFLTSISTPKESKENYVVIIGSLQLGGICASFFSWQLLTRTMYNDFFKHQIILYSCAVLLLIVPFILYLLFRFVHESFLQGYRGIERHGGDDQKSCADEQLFKKLFNGLTILAKNNYILGIFAILFFWEVINVVFSYQRLLVGADSCSSLAQLSGLFFSQVFLLNSIGFAIVVIGSGPLIGYLGYMQSLMLVPLLMTGLIGGYILFPSPQALSVAYSLLRALNFAFASPLREILYTPTSSDLRFKSKSWIDVFGARFAKSVGAYYNIFTASLAESMLFASHSIFFALILSCWFFVAYCVGRQFEHAIKNNLTIK